MRLRFDPHSSPLICSSAAARSRRLRGDVMLKRLLSASARGCDGLGEFRVVIDGWRWMASQKLESIRRDYN